jgi:hypothetical protein
LARSWLLLLLRFQTALDHSVNIPERLALGLTEQLSDKPIASSVSSRSFTAAPTKPAAGVE